MKRYHHLQSPHDLLNKLQHDVAELEAHPEDVYRAFNALVTAEHMADWVHPGKRNKDARTRLRSDHVILQACSHVANGMKHFVAEAKHHKAVREVRRDDVFAGVFGDVYGSVFEFGPLLIELDGEAAKELGPQISVVDLSQKLLKFWDDRLREESEVS